MPSSLTGTKEVSLRGVQFDISVSREDEAKGSVFVGIVAKDAFSNARHNIVFELKETNGT